MLDQAIDIEPSYNRKAIIKVNDQLKGSATYKLEEGGATDDAAASSMGPIDDDYNHSSVKGLIVNTSVGS